MMMSESFEHVVSGPRSVVFSYIISGDVDVFIPNFS